MSRLCFGQSTAPEDELIIMLLDIVFTKPMQVEKIGEGEEGNKGESEEETLGTRNLTPFNDDKDEQPVIRSILLQLLLEHKYVTR